jgi:hypothetical protein
MERDFLAIYKSYFRSSLYFVFATIGGWLETLLIFRKRYKWILALTDSKLSRRCVF